MKISYQEGKILGFQMVNSLSKNQLLTSKRGNVISLSDKSVVFSFEEQLFKAAPRWLCYPSANRDELIEWGRKELPPLKLRNSSVSFDTINGESMKCVINGHVHPRDSVEKIQYASQFGGATLYCQGVSTADVSDVLRDPENYPVSITFKRPTVNEVVVEGAGTAEFNGTYKRDGEKNDFPSFVKKGRYGKERWRSSSCVLSVKDTLGAS